MPYPTNESLPPSVKSRYSDHCQTVWRDVWTSISQAHPGDESRAFAGANSAAERCQKGVQSGMTTPAAARPQHPGEFNFITNALEVAPAENGRRRFHTIMSSTVQDRAKNEVKLTALEDLRDAFRAGLVIWRNHDYTVPDSIFGQSDESDIRDSGKVDKAGHPIWDLHVGGWVLDSNSKANELADAIDAGIRVGASIGAWPINPKRNADGGLIIEHMEAGEGSIVGMPKNQRSLVQKAVNAMATWSADIPLIDEEADEGQERSIVDEITDKVMANLTTNSISSASMDGLMVGDPPETFGDLSSKARKEMPDSEFACPEKRLYPIHDAAHVRAALSRVADPNNDQCGKAKIIAAARRMGIGEHGQDQKSLTDDELLTWAAKTCPECGGTKDSPKDGCKASFHAGDTDNDGDRPDEGDDPDMDQKSITTIETTATGQEADAATPETAVEAVQEANEATPETTAGATDAETFGAEDVATLVEHTRRLVAEVGTLRDENVALKAEVESLKGERDRISAGITGIRGELDAAMKLPLRPRAQGHVGAAVEKFSMFSPEVADAIARLTQE